MIITAYLDESGTHNGSPVTVMAGFLGNAEQWESFGRGLRLLQERYGFTVFHATEFKHGRGEFRGWSDIKCLSLVKEMSELAAKELMAGASMVLDNDDYKRYQQAPRARKVRIDTAYGLCFRACLVHFLEILDGVPSNDDQPTKLHVVVESGHRHFGDADRVFNEVKRAVSALMRKAPLGSITSMDKESCQPLMVADFLAHTEFMQHDKVRPIEPSIIITEEMKSGASLTRLKMPLNYLVNLSEHFNNLRLLIDRAERKAE